MTMMTNLPAGAPAAPAAAAPAPAAAPAAAPALAAPAGAPAAAAPAGGAPAAAPEAGSPEAIAAAEAAAAAAAAGGKTPEQIAADEAAAAEAAAKAAGAPEKYTDFTAPENAALDPAVMTEFASVARELNLPQDKAQLLVDKMQPIMAARQAEQVATLTASWETETRADPEIGGVNMDANLVHAARAMNTFATPAFKEVLNRSGLGNHPELVRFMVKAGKAISEEKIVSGGIPASSGGIRSAADTLYPTPSVKK